jgi:hypothetical protein
MRRSRPNMRAPVANGELPFAASSGSIPRSEAPYREAGEVPAKRGGEPRHQYFLCTRGREPLSIDLDRYRDVIDDVFLKFWVGAFREMERWSSGVVLTVYVVWDYQSIRDLPSYGDDVVALILQDEYCAIPKYYGRVRFIFKTYGFRPRLCGRVRGGMGLLTLAKFIKDCGNWAQHFAVYSYSNPRFPFLKLPSSQDSLVVPLGYARQADIRPKPFSQRKYLVSFIGSVQQYRLKRWSARSLMGTPKNAARLKMLKSLARLARNLPADAVFAEETCSYTESILSDGSHYSEIMRDTKICLAPRGSSVETYRFFEALRYGCVVICDRLPAHWFYVGSPAIQIDNWDILDAVVLDLIADPIRLNELHQASVRWWEAVCSEKAIGRALAKCLCDAASMRRQT